MSTYDLIATKIIKEQELIIGPVAWYEAEKVSGLQIIDKKTGTVAIKDANQGSVLDRLVSQYEHLFGRASKEVCKEAAAALIASLPTTEIPVSLR